MRGQEIGPVLFPFTGRDAGGSHISSFHLARALIHDHGIDARAVVLPGTSIAAEAARLGVPVMTSGGAPRRRLFALSDLARFAQRRRLLKGLGPSAIVHCSDMWSIAAWAPVAKSLGLPVIYHSRTLFLDRPSHRLLLKLADAVIAISAACRTSLRGIDPARVIEVLNPFAPPPPIDREEARAEFAARWPIAGLKLVGVSGNFARRKRVDHFVEAAALLAAKEPAARFIVFGRDRQQSTDELTTLATRLGVADKLFFAGFRSPPERNLAALDVLAAPALAEPFGRTLVEALMVGTPYVATDDAGHGEIHARWGGGVLVPKDAGPQAFADALGDVLTRPDAYCLDAATRSRLEADVAPATHAANVLAVYRQVLERRG